jgi:hypothetical protein
MKLFPAKAGGQRDFDFLSKLDFPHSVRETTEKGLLEQETSSFEIPCSIFEV